MWVSLVAELGRIISYITHKVKYKDKKYPRKCGGKGDFKRVILPRLSREDD